MSNLKLQAQISSQNLERGPVESRPVQFAD